MIKNKIFYFLKHFLPSLLNYYLYAFKFQSNYESCFFLVILNEPLQPNVSNEKPRRLINQNW